jgi:hypothetical protein
MSFGHFYLGYLLGQQQAQTDRHFEDFARILSSGKGIQGIVYLIPALEGIMAGYAIYSLISGSTGLLHWPSLHLDGFYGWVGAILAFGAWISLFGLPVLGSILNVIVSSFWAGGVYSESHSAKWMTVLFFASLGMHYAVFLAGGPAGNPTHRERRREHITLLVTTLLVLSVLLSFGLFSASIDNRALPLPTARDAGAMFLALCVFIGAWTVVTRHAAKNEQAKSWLPMMSLLGILVSGYFIVGWLDKHVLVPLTQSDAGQSGASRLGADNTCQNIPDYPYIARVAVATNGTIRLNGVVTSLQSLDGKLAALGPNSGMWLYQEGRSEGKQNAAVIDEVIRLQMKHKMHFTNSGRSDFRDVACMPYWRNLKP